MQMMALTIALLFATGFAGGYFTRAALSWWRRNKLRRHRSEQEADAVLKQASVQRSPAGKAEPLNA
jgi:hypothetical protein